MIKVCCVDEKKKKRKSEKTTCREFNMADAKKTKVLVEWSMSNPPKIEKKNENQEK